MKKKNRRKTLIIVFAAAAVILPLTILLIVSGMRTGTAEPNEQKKAAVQKVGQQKTKQEIENAFEKETEPETKARRKTVQEETLPQQNTEQMKQPIPSVNSETRQLSADERPAPAVETPTQAETKAHVHAYQLSDTRKIDHPAVTKQVWVEDSAAWDEVIRAGYHMSVVTCHQCGAQFSDPAQANALEAWGDHIDAVHDGDGSYDMAASYDVPAKTVHHDAAGHYEQKVVTAGWTEYTDTYRCSCGDQYTKTR